MKDSLLMRDKPQDEAVPILVRMLISVCVCVCVCWSVFLIIITMIINVQTSK